MDVPRAGNGRPYIVHDGKVKYYSRASNFAQPLKDSKGLEVHHNKQIIKGVLVDPSIGAVFAKNGGMKLGTDAEKDEDVNHKVLFAMSEKAIEAAGGMRKAHAGTRIHTATEFIDKSGQVPFDLFQQIQPNIEDINAYIEATKELEKDEIETFVVNDRWKTAGTFDRNYSCSKPIRLRFEDTVWTLPPGRYIGDIKTGTLEYTPAAFAVQLANYAGAERYSCEHPAPDGPSKEECENNLECHPRTPLNVSQDVGLLVHLPLEKGECHIYPLDLRFGRESMALVETIKAWRSTKIDKVLMSDFFI